jgi:hypothetical protein
MNSSDGTQIKRLLTPFSEAIEQLKRRKNDAKLEQRVEEYLNADIPNYFLDVPVFYLARHIATPNFETLRFMHLLDSAGFKIIIGQDGEDMFVASNPMKKALIKLPIHTGFSLKDKKYHERFHYQSIGDINMANGKKLSEITTNWDQSLISFHTELCRQYFHDRVSIVNDGPWIDRNHRGNLLEHYKRFLALFIVHGVLFEDYLIEDEQERDFIEEVLTPAFQWVEQHFGCRPLIAQLNPTSVESEHFWISYPSEVGEIIKKKYTLE